VQDVAPVCDNLLGVGCIEGGAADNMPPNRLYANLEIRLVATAGTEQRCGRLQEILIPLFRTAAVTLQW
jgi:hypothetical protein